jgi:hypothetical protein
MMHNYTISDNKYKTMHNYTSEDSLFIAAILHHVKPDNLKPHRTNAEHSAHSDHIKEDAGGMRSSREGV